MESCICRANRSTWRNSTERLFVQLKSHMDEPGIEPGPQRWEANCLKMLLRVYLNLVWFNLAQETEREHTILLAFIRAYFSFELCENGCPLSTLAVKSYEKCFLQNTGIPIYLNHIFNLLNTILEAIIISASITHIHLY